MPFNGAALNMDGKVANILLCTEATRDDGALRRLVLVEAQLAKHGHDCKIAAADLSYVMPLGVVNLDRILPGPAPGRFPRPADYIDTVSAMLLQSGFSSWARLAANVAAWRNLAQLAAPDLVVVDSSPAVTMALSERYAVLQIGAGARIPPQRGLAGALGPEGDSSSLGAQARDTLVSAINRVRGLNKQTAIASVDEALNTTSRMICCLAEFDPFLPQREEKVVGPLQQLPAPSPPDAAAPVVMFLDADYEQGQAAIMGLGGSGIRIQFFAPGMAPQAAQTVQERGIAVITERLPRTADWAGASLVIHHGDLHLSETLLAMGRPQLLLPRDPEQQQVAQALVRRGIGVMLTKPNEVGAIGKILQRLAVDDDFRARAYAWGRTVQDDAGGTGLGKVVEECEALLARGARSA